MCYRFRALQQRTQKGHNPGPNGNHLFSRWDSYHRKTHEANGAKRDDHTDLCYIELQHTGVTKLAGPSFTCMFSLINLGWALCQTVVFERAFTREEEGEEERKKKRQAKGLGLLCDHQIKILNAQLNNTGGWSLTWPNQRFDIYLLSVTSHLIKDLGQWGWGDTFSLPFLAQPDSLCSLFGPQCTFVASPVCGLPLALWSSLQYQWKLTRSSVWPLFFSFLKTVRYLYPPHANSSRILLLSYPWEISTLKHIYLHMGKFN